MQKDAFYRLKNNERMPWRKLQFAVVNQFQRLVNPNRTVAKKSTLVSIDMEKTLNAIPNGQNIQADKVLEININHDVLSTLKEVLDQDEEKLKLYTNLLYNQAMLIEGLPVSDPVEFTNDICKVMVS